MSHQNAATARQHTVAEVACSVAELACSVAEVACYQPREDTGGGVRRTPLLRRPVHPISVLELTKKRSRCVVDVTGLVARLPESSSTILTREMPQLCASRTAHYQLFCPRNGPDSKRCLCTDRKGVSEVKPKRKGN